jgi:hypothetical protein
MVTAETFCGTCDLVNLSNCHSVLMACDLENFLYHSDLNDVSYGHNDPRNLSNYHSDRKNLSEGSLESAESL